MVNVILWQNDRNADRETAASIACHQDILAYVTPSGFEPLRQKKNRYRICLLWWIISLPAAVRLPVASQLPYKAFSERRVTRNKKCFTGHSRLRSRPPSRVRTPASGRLLRIISSGTPTPLIKGQVLAS